MKILPAITDVDLGWVALVFMAVFIGALIIAAGARNADQEFDEDQYEEE